jgi:hypothetical protein
MTAVSVTVQGLNAAHKKLEAKHAQILARGSKATGAAANVYARVIKAKAPRRKGITSAKTQAKKRDASQWSRSPEPVVRAKLSAHVKVYAEGRMPHQSSTTDHKIRMTGHVWHLILGPVRMHEETAGTFRGRASGRKALQLMTGGYAAHAIHPGHPAADWWHPLIAAAGPEAHAAAREVLENG